MQTQSNFQTRVIVGKKARSCTKSAEHTRLKNVHTVAKQKGIVRQNLKSGTCSENERKKFGPTLAKARHFTSAPTARKLLARGYSLHVRLASRAA